MAKEALLCPKCDGWPWPSGAYCALCGKLPECKRQEAYRVSRAHGEKFYKRIPRVKRRRKARSA